MEELIHKLNKELVTLEKIIVEVCVVTFDPKVERSNTAKVQSRVDSCSLQFKEVYSRMKKYKQLYGSNTVANNALVKVNSQLVGMFHKFNAYSSTVKKWISSQEDSLEYVHSISNQNDSPSEQKEQKDSMELLQFQYADSYVLERQREIAHLTSSIQDLANMFTQIHSMVLSQGELIDRIDVQIENTLENVRSANEQLKPAEEYSRKRSKMTCICIVALLFMFIGLLIAVIFKYNK
jgi:methyl-accepting chemotaxis protein